MARTLPARDPLHGAWSEMMRADMAAAFFDRKDTRDLSTAVVRGEIPPPCRSIGTGKAKEPVWTRSYCLAFIGRRHDAGGAERAVSEDLADMV